MYNFEGDVDNISERQLEFINNVILEHGFKDSKIFFEVVGKPGDNYVASVKRITIEGPNGTLKMIAKIAPTLETIRQAMNTIVMFRNEHLMYTEVLPKLVQLQKNADIPEKDQLRYAKCFGSLSEQPNEVILLEDLKTSDYVMLSRFSTLSKDCIKSVLKNFAVLHSLSFVLRHKEPETYSNFKNSLRDVWLLLGKVIETKMYFQALEDDMLTIIEDPKYCDFLRHKVTNVLSLAQKFANENDSKYIVIQQGDSWTNNIMFKFEGENLIDSVMIDYQISKNASPACDILYLIFNCTDHEARMKNFYDWIDYYHSELEKSLLNFNLKANFIYPRDRLDADLKRYAKFIFGHCLIIASIIIRDSDDAISITDAMKNNNVQEDAQRFFMSSVGEDTKTRFRNRIIELIESYTELGLT